MNVKDDDVKALESIADLPDDVIGDILSLLSGEYIKEVFLHWKPTREYVIDRYFRKEVHFLVSPLKVQKHYCSAKIDSEICDFKYTGEIEDFLDENPEIIPEKLLFECGGDFVSLYDILMKYEDRIKQSKYLELKLDWSLIDESLLTDVLSFDNISRLQLGHFKFNGWVRSFFKRIFPQMKNLKTLQILGHNVSDWSKYKLPPNVNSLDISWYDLTKPLSINFDNNNLTEIYLNKANVDNSIFKELKKAKNVKHLMLTYNRKLENLLVDHLPRQLEKLDVLHNNISKIETTNTELSWPDSLQELNLSLNSLELLDLLAIKWSQNLKNLHIILAELVSLNQLGNLPESLETLVLDSNHIHIPASHIYNFPKNLKELSFCGNELLLLSTSDMLRSLNIPSQEIALLLENENVHSINLPPSLKILDLSGCRLKSLNRFSSFESLSSLNISQNFLSDLTSHDIDWTKLIHLQTLDASDNKISSIDTWKCPSNLEQLFLSENKIQEITSSCYLFSSLFCSQSKLKSIDLSCGNISQIAHDICVPQNQTCLKLTRNRLGPEFHLPPNLTQLNELHIEINAIASFTCTEATSVQPLKYIKFLPIAYLLDDRLLVSPMYDELEKALGHKIVKRYNKESVINLKTS